MKSLKLTDTNLGYRDMILENGIFSWVEDGAQAAQHALERLHVFEGEWEFNTELGTRWYAVIFDVSKSRAEKEFELQRIILGTPGIKSIKRWVWTQSGRVVNISAGIQTDWGDEEFTEVLEPY
jgi:hypothetical protein